VTFLSPSAAFSTFVRFVGPASPQTHARPRTVVNRRRLGRFWRSDNGNVAIVFSLSLPVVIGGAGLGVETSYWFYKDLQLQAAADAAAYAGALEKRSGSSNSKVTEAAEDAAIKNRYNTAIGTIEVNSPPSSGPSAGTPAVEVILVHSLDRYFSKIFEDGPVIVRARAVANYQVASEACLLALHPSASKAILFSGNSSMQLTGCSVMANSVADDAVKSQGSADVSVDCIISAGGVDLGYGASMSECTSPIVNAPPVADPFASLPVPTAPGSCLNDNAATLQPGRYCSGLNINKEVTLSPGVYFISGGDFKINANGDVSGEDVTIYLDGDARVSINGNATVNLSAPTEEEDVYAGILFFTDRDSSGGAANTFNGTAGSLLTGAIYSASQDVQYLGDFSGVDGCTRIVGRTIEWSGNAEFNQDCSALGIPSIPAMQVVNLAE
jgi:hypothetical protein